MRNRSKAVAVLLAGVALGLLAVAQAKTVRFAGGDVSSAHVRQLNEQVASLSQQKGSLQSRLDELNKQVTVLEADEQKAKSQLEQANAEAEQVRAKAGLTALHGPGVVIVIAPRTFTQGGEKKIVKAITDEELLLLVNELNAAGAEAVSINGQRIVARTAIRLAGDFVNINLMPTAMPYEVRALGHADSLDTALRLYGGIFERYQEFYQISIQKSDEVSIPAYQGSSVFRYAVAEKS